MFDLISSPRRVAYLLSFVLVAGIMLTLAAYGDPSPVESAWTGLEANALAQVTPTQIPVSDYEIFEMPGLSVVYSARFADAEDEFEDLALLFAPGRTGLDAIYASDEIEYMEVVQSPSPYNQLDDWVVEVEDNFSVNIVLDQDGEVPVASISLPDGFELRAFIVNGIFITVSGSDASAVDDFTGIILGEFQIQTATTSVDQDSRPVEITGFDDVLSSSSIDLLLGDDAPSGAGTFYASQESDLKLFIIRSESPFATFSEWLETQPSTVRVETVNGVEVAFVNNDDDKPVAAFQMDGVFVSITLIGADTVEIGDVVSLYLDQVVDEPEETLAHTGVEIEIDGYDGSGSTAEYSTSVLSILGEDEEILYMPGGSGYYYNYGNPEEMYDFWFVTLSNPPYESIDEWSADVEAFDGGSGPYTTQTVVISGVDVVIVTNGSETIYGMLMENTMVAIFGPDTHSDGLEFVEAYINGFLSR